MVFTPSDFGSKSRKVVHKEPCLGGGNTFLQTRGQKQAQRKKMQGRGQKLVTKGIVENQHVSYTYKVDQTDRGSFVAHGFLLFYTGFCEPFRQYVKVD